MRIDPDGARAMVLRTGGRGARRPWLQLLNEILGLPGGKAELVRHGERPWASATFSGARHTIVLSFAGAGSFDDAEDFMAALPDHEFAIARQIVADAAVVGVDQVSLPEPRMTVEAELLLLDDG